MLKVSSPGSSAAQVIDLAGVLLGVQVITSSGTYTPTAGMKKILSCCIGGGGGSGGVAATDASTVAVAAGGGAGEVTYSLLTAAQIGASQSCTIGAGGSGAAAGNPNVGGGTTSLGTLQTAAGAPGNYPTRTGATGALLINGSGRGGQGGTKNLYSYTATQAAGGYCNGTFGLSGAGASAGFGVGAGLTYLTASGAGSPPGGGYGAGASGPVNFPSSSAQGGQGGAAGAIIIWEFA